MEPILVVSSILLWIVVLFNLLLTLVIIRRLNFSTHQINNRVQSESLVGQKAPDFTAEFLSGEKASFDHFRGHTVVFLFISPNCAPCIENLPHYHKLSLEAAARGIKFFLVSNGSKEQTQNLVNAHKIDLPILVTISPENPFMRDYKITGTPAFLLVDKEGTVQMDGYPNPQFGFWKRHLNSWGGVRG